MSSKRRKGDSDDAEILNQAFDDTTAIVTDGDDMREFDSVGAQLIVDYASEEFSGSASDDVDAASTTWTLTEFDFTGRGGATIRVSGATNDENNGDFVISSVSSANVIVTATAVGLVDETFTDALRVEVLATDDPPAGDWSIEVSNNFVPETNGTVYGQPSNAGDWTDITSQFSPTIAAVVDADSQYVQADLTARDIRYTFTPSGGQGVAKVRRFAKSWS